MFKKIRLASFIISFPVFALAQNLTNTTTLLRAVRDIITTYLIPIAFTLALLYFFYGVAKYIKSEGANKAEARQILWYGVVALFVISSVWGLVFWLRSELIGQNNPNTVPIPTIGVPGAGNV